MPRESFAAKLQRTEVLLGILANTYPEAHCELNYSNPLQLLIATILSAQCTDRQVNIVTAKLFQKYRAASDYARVPLAELEEDIRAIGLFRSKAKNIQNCCLKLMERHEGEVPRTMEELIALDGVGRKTANVVLGNAFGISEGVVVDTHVARVSARLGLTQETQPEKVERMLQRLVPKARWMIFSHWLIWHGRRRCYARNPDCAHCELLAHCPAGASLSKNVCEKP